MKPNALLSKEYLLEHYINQGKTVVQIQNELGIKSHNSVVQALRKHRIPARAWHETTEAGKIKRSEKIRKGYEGISGSTWYIIQYHARIRHIDILVTIEDIWNLYLKQEGKCAISGVEISLAKKNTYHGRRDSTASLDRIDSSKAYTIDNVQWIHKRIQTMKMHHNQEELIEWCKIIAEYNKG